MTAEPHLPDHAAPASTRAPAAKPGPTTRRSPSRRGPSHPGFGATLDYDAEIRRVLCSTNAIESLNARYRRAVRTRGHFLSDQAALKCLYLVTRSLDPTGTGRARWAVRTKPVIDAMSITFRDRWPSAEISRNHRYRGSPASRRRSMTGASRGPSRLRLGGSSPEG